MKAFYADYINHMFRFYIRHQDKQKLHTLTPVDEANWNACEKVFRSLSESDQKMMTAVFGNFGMLGDCMRDYSAQSGISLDSLWERLSVVTLDTAKERGLV